MERFVVLLRGVNVGRGNRVAMAALRSLLEQLGCRHVSTLLNSGNAVFCAPAQLGARAEALIGQALMNESGVSVPVIVKSARQFGSIVSANPSPAVSDPSRFLVAFSSRQQDLEALAALEPLLAPGESLCITPHAAYLHCTGGILQSKAAAALLGKLGRNVTTRNWATVLKIADALSRVPPATRAGAEGASDE
ncbi:MAG: DUF1697 domain-containing protein [Krumholzibacteria bacterium]|nr:DUF1697 domain-containing protein [Candidatus Krumholzibacteria bacterium]